MPFEGNVGAMKKEAEVAPAPDAEGSAPDATGCVAALQAVAALQPGLKCTPFADFCSEIMCNFDDCIHCINNEPNPPVRQKSGNGSGTCVHALLNQQQQQLAAKGGAGALKGSAAAGATIQKGPNGEVVRCVHEHRTEVVNGKEVKKCTHTHTHCAKTANRLAVKKYRLKKKNEFESLKNENTLLKTRVSELEYELKNRLEGENIINSLRQDEADELLRLRRVVKQMAELIEPLRKI